MSVVTLYELRKRKAYSKVLSASARGYGKNWLKLRKYVLMLNPICMFPECEELATVVDHVIPKEAGGTDDLSNLKSSCKRHHDQKTAKVDSGFRRRLKCPPCLQKVLEDSKSL